jgi:transcriptional regulator with XRE-family HTH domain
MNEHAAASALAHHGWCGALISLTPDQLRMARAALNWSIAELARNSGVSISTLQRIERLSPVSRNHLLSSFMRIIDCLRAHGVTLLHEQDGGAAGIRFQERLLAPQLKRAD